MRIVVAPDSFKDALGASAVATAIAEGLRRGRGDHEIICIPMADGGEGTLDVLLGAVAGRRQRVAATGPLGEPVDVTVGLINQASTAVIESALVSGYGLVPQDRRDPLRATTYGLGQVIRSVIEAGLEEIILTLGGSATVDGGAGMMQALGMTCLDESGRVIRKHIGGGDLSRIRQLCWDKPPEGIEHVQFTIACDVLNPACGPRGAAAVFAPQKGADAATVEKLERGLSRWVDLLEAASGRELRNEPGTGAAGGVALPLLALSGATLRPGVDLVSETVDLAHHVGAADLVITGEGRLDGQSMMGKVVGSVGRMSKAAGVPCVAIVGSTGDGAEACRGVLDDVYTLDCPLSQTQLRLREVAERVAEFPFTVAFAYTHDETNHMADVLLPEATDLESLQLMRLGTTKYTEQFWKHEGWAIRQPAGDKTVDCRDMTDIATELAERLGLLEEYNAAINRGAAGMRLTGEGFDYSLDATKAHGLEEIWDAVAKAASHDLSGGEEVHGIDWFKEHGFMLKPYSQLEWYLYPTLKEQGLRFELPYQERILRHGSQLAERLHEVGIEWWDKQLEEYEALPSYKPFPEIWINYAKEVGRDPAEFPFWAVTARSMQYAWGANVGIPLINEVAQNISGHKGVIINRTAAAKLGLAEGDPVVIESVAGVTKGYAVLREGIRPDTVLMIGQFDHWVTPFAKDLNLPSLNTVSSMSLSLTDSTGSGADLARVSIRKGEGPRRAA